MFTSTIFFLGMNFSVSELPVRPTSPSCSLYIKLFTGNILHDSCLREFKVRFEYYAIQELFRNRMNLEPYIVRGAVELGSGRKPPALVDFENTLWAMGHLRSKCFVRPLTSMAGLLVSTSTNDMFSTKENLDTPVGRAISLYTNDYASAFAIACLDMMFNEEGRVNALFVVDANKNNTSILRKMLDTFENTYTVTNKKDVRRLYAIQSMVRQIERTNWYDGDRDADIAKRCATILEQLPKRSMKP